MAKIIVIGEDELKKLIKDSISSNNDNSSSDKPTKFQESFVKAFNNFTKGLREYLDKEFGKVHQHLREIDDRLYKIENKIR